MVFDTDEVRRRYGGGAYLRGKKRHFLLRIWSKTFILQNAGQTHWNDLFNKHFTHQPM